MDKIITQQKEQDLQAWNIWNSEYVYNGRSVNCAEFVRLQIESGSKAKWFDCPLIWDAYMTEYPDQTKDHLEAMRSIVAGMVLSIKCQFCTYGHMLNCHYPHTCNEVDCQ